ncbi:1,4-alpha-glucan branching protein GlgB [uncultured Chryseobacterium sp.]|uniref:1,4-alpha-glucan branching protein GlgB n=1 Tax=uncultured Chryseobacterium sp. TaxID=259322 RepID=UPI0025D833C8|nr:1,4-alpha-glucan branching protein GlgB [uncultured Chryseobacterium sp.]
MNSVKTYTLFTDQDIYLFKEGKHYKLYDKFGAHSAEKDGVQGVYFSVWAPNARKVSVIGNFNSWNPDGHILFPRWDGSGIWEGFIAGLTWGTLYKYAIETYRGEILEKSDPYALSWEQNLQAASLVSTTWYEWKDKDWMENRWKKNTLNAPLSVYEMHLGSWMRDEHNPERYLNYRDVAAKLIPYIKETGFTHVEFMPLMEYPYDPSWGYQITGFYAATSRFGSPQDLMFLIDELHRNEIGVILDWVPSHFPGDANGLHRFDGSHLYEHEDPRKGFHPDWKSYIFNYGRNEVKSFLISNAMFWLERYHADGLRVDAVTSMLHLDYSRNEGEWEPNIYGGNVNLEAKTFLQEFNTAVYKEFGDNIITIAEESSDFPKLTKPVHDGGVGFGMKWMMGWMHDTLAYFKEDPIDRKFFHHKLTFASMYMYNENYMMPLSHDEVVHGKASLIYKMKGDEWQKFANLRALYVYMFTHPGAKLLFMGDEFGQTSEWNFKKSLDWHLLDYPVHKGLQTLVKDLNHLYRKETAFYENQFSPEGFEWVEADDTDNSVYIYLRKGKKKDDFLMIILNLTPRVLDYKIGVDAGSHWEIIFSSDDEKYAGSGVEPDIFREDQEEYKGHKKSISIKLPPLAGVVLRKKHTNVEEVKTINIKDKKRACL